MTTTQKLERLHRGPTRYEVILATAGGAEYLIGYTGRKSGHGLVEMARTMGDEIVELLGVDDETPFAFGKGRQSATFGDKGGIRFSGRTERDAIVNGEMARLAS